MLRVLLYVTTVGQQAFGKGE